jgi:hypothetical protein
MKLKKAQLRKLILEELQQQKIIKEDLTPENFQKYAAKLFNYLVQKAMKPSPMGFAVIMSTYGDEIIDLIVKDDLDGAIALFKEKYDAL